MSVATDNNPATPARGEQPHLPAGTVEWALTAAIRDATRIGDLLDALRSARIWLPLPAGGPQVTREGAVNLPTVTYLGGEFVPAYTSAELLAQLAGGADGAAASDPVPPETVPHLVVRAADLASLLPPGVGIALNPGATESVPIYPHGVAFLAADDDAADLSRVSVGPVPEQPEALFAEIDAGLAGIPAVSKADAAWLSVRFSGEGLVVSVTLDDPANFAVRDEVVTALELAAARHDAGFPIDVTFPGVSDPDYLDRWIAAFGTRFYQRAD
jgi:SseB protein N-terminal domain